MPHVWRRSGLKVDLNVDLTMCVVVCALYGLKSAGALHDIGFVSTVADPDVWIRLATHENGYKYYKCCLCTLTMYWLSCMNQKC
jgi:hypothetical protein